MDVTGLEDEYRSVKDKPRLIYIREPSPDRDPRLSDLLDRIKRDGQTSYKSFRSPSELQGLIEQDMALLLSERFEEAGLGSVPQSANGTTGRVPTGQWMGDACKRRGNRRPSRLTPQELRSQSPSARGQARTPTWDSHPDVHSAAMT